MEKQDPPKRNNEMCRRRMLEVSFQLIHTAAGVVFCAVPLLFRQSQALAQPQGCECEPCSAPNICEQIDSCEGGDECEWDNCFTNTCDVDTCEQHQCTNRDECISKDHCTRNDACTGSRDECAWDFCYVEDECSQTHQCDVDRCTETHTCEDEHDICEQDCDNDGCWLIDL